MSSTAAPEHLGDDLGIEDRAAVIDSPRSASEIPRRRSRAVSALPSRPQALDETGAANLPEGEEQVVARLDASSRIRRGEKAELWADTTRLHLFDPDSGASLMSGESPVSPR